MLFRIFLRISCARMIFKFRGNPKKSAVCNIITTRDHRYFFGIFEHSKGVLRFKIFFLSLLPKLATTHRQAKNVKRECVSKTKKKKKNH